MANKSLFFVTFTLLFWTIRCSYSTNTTDLYIGGFFGVNIKKGAWSSAALIPILEMALEHVNNDPRILVGYQLKYVWNDSKVCRGKKRDKSSNVKYLQSGKIWYRLSYPLKIQKHLATLSLCYVQEFNIVKAE